MSSTSSRFDLTEAGVGEAVDRVLADRFDALERRAELVVGEPAEDDGFDRAVEVARLLGGDVGEVAGRIIAGGGAGAAAHRLDQLLGVQVRLRVAGDALADVDFGDGAVQPFGGLAAGAERFVAGVENAGVGFTIERVSECALHG